MEDKDLELVESKDMGENKLCILFAGLLNAGKTYGSLLLASELLDLEAKKTGKKKFVLGIDTENAMQNYAKTFSFKMPTRNFVENRDPESLTHFLEKVLEAIENNHPVYKDLGALVVDSVTDIWVESLDEIAQAETRGSYGFSTQREHGKISLKLDRLKTILAGLKSHVHVILTCKLKPSASGTDAKTKQANVEKISDIATLCDFANIKKDFFYLPPVIALAYTKSVANQPDLHRIKVLANKTDSFLEEKKVYELNKEFIEQLSLFVDGGENVKPAPKQTKPVSSAKKEEVKEEPEAKPEQKVPKKQAELIPPKPVEKTLPKEKVALKEDTEDGFSGMQEVLSAIRKILEENEIDEDNLIVYMNNNRKNKDSFEYTILEDGSLDNLTRLLNAISKPDSKILNLLKTNSIMS